MIEKESMYALTYGLYVVTAKSKKGQNGCIVNTVAMLTDTPTRITVYVNKSNYTEECIRNAGEFNVSVLAESAPLSVFRHFGFRSGRDEDKFADATYPVTENGVYYLPENTNAVLSAKVVDAYDYGTHTLFVAEVTEAKKLSDEPSMTYAYYQRNVKQRAPVAEESAAERWVCKICGYVHEGALPDDFICPWCKHPASDFEKIS